MVSSVVNVPQRGDAVWIDLNPQMGSEQAGLRLAIVLSPGAYNGKVGLVLVCPITNRKKGYPFEVNISEDIKVSGVILADQMKSLDWRVRNAKVITSLPKETVEETLHKVSLLLTKDNDSIND